MTSYNHCSLFAVEVHHMLCECPHCDRHNKMRSVEEEWFAFAWDMERRY